MPKPDDKKRKRAAQPPKRKRKAVGWSDKMTGGLGDKKRPSDFDRLALKKGIKVEMEHTTDRAVATEIAMDHLTEDPQYYDKLEQMERRGKRKRPEPTKKAVTWEQPLEETKPLGGEDQTAEQDHEANAPRNIAEKRAWNQGESGKRMSMWEMVDFFKFSQDYDPPVWDPDNDDDFELDEIVYFLAQRRSGKTVTATDLLLRKRKYYPVAFVYTNTSKNNYWQQFVPVKNVIPKWDEKHVGRVLELGAETVNEYWAHYNKTGRRRGNPYTCIVAEDLIDGGLMKKSKMARRLFFNGRHHGIGCYIMSQDYSGLTPGQRANIDRLIIFKTTDRRTREALDRMFGRSFIPLLDRVTSVKHQCLVINCKASCPKEEMVKKYKADMDFIERLEKQNARLCCKAVWKRSAEGGDDEDGGEDPIITQKRKYAKVGKKPTNANLLRNFDKGLTSDDEADEVDARYDIEPDDTKEEHEDDLESNDPFPDWGFTPLLNGLLGK